MARDSTALIRAEPLPDMGSGIEVLVANARLQHHVYSGNGGVIDTVEEALATLLISVAPGEADRRATRALAQTVIGADCRFLQGPDTEDLRRRLLRSLGNGSQRVAFAVLALPAKLDLCAQCDVEDLLTMLRAQHQLCLVVAITEAPLAWMSTKLVDGFVRADFGRTGATSNEVFRLLASMAAPTMAPCIDDSDLRKVIGSAEKPATMVHGIWMPKENRLLFTVKDGATVRHCTAIAFSAPDNFQHLSTLRTLTDAIRAAASLDTQIHFTMTCGLFASSALEDVLLVPMMCR